jgi:hypothetical protein
VVDSLAAAAVGEALAAAAPAAAAPAAGGNRKDWAMNTEQLMKELYEAIGPGLKSVVLYGSAAAGDFVEGVSAYDVLIVAEKLGAAELAALSVPLARWEGAGNPLPQLFTPDELAASADVFPIELVDMQQSRHVLLGNDPLANIKIDMQLYRVQLERELKTRLLLLRRKYLACCGRSDAVTRLMAASVSTFLVLLRAALRLYNDSVPAEKTKAVEALGKHVTFDAEPLLAVQQLKQRKHELTAGEIDSLFGQYLNSIEQVVQAVDRDLHPSSS